MPWSRVSPRTALLGQGTARARARAKAPEDIPGPAVPGDTQPGRRAPAGPAAGRLERGCWRAALRVREMVLSKSHGGRSHSFLHGGQALVQAPFQQRDGAGGGFTVCASSQQQ